MTPTLILFSGMLFGCMAVLPPWPSAWPVGITLGLFGLTGLVYQIHVILKRARSIRLLDVLVKRESDVMPMIPAGKTYREIILEKGKVIIADT